MILTSNVSEAAQAVEWQFIQINVVILLLRQQEFIRVLKNKSKNNFWYFAIYGKKSTFTSKYTCYTFHVPHVQHSVSAT